MSKSIKLYHRTGVHLVPGGYCGPETGIEVPANQARAWLHDNPRDWRRRPWTQPAVEDEPTSEEETE